ncbi:MAG: triose-phosphate isomerase [Tistrella sp.]|nr:triose-phosphate isomerase [Tistrella sp.]
MPHRPTPLVAGNWKMNMLVADGRALAAEVAAGAEGLAAGFAVCPPAALLPVVGEAIRGSKVALGAQDCHAKASGAHTGDHAAALLKDVGCTYVIVGHSERRQDHGETDAVVAAKAEAAAAAGLVPIVCVGETLDQYKAGEGVAVVEAQVDGSVPASASADRLVVAYEPVWAIGSGLVPTTDDIRAVHGAIRARLAARFGDAAQGIRILYGGSVKPGNAAEILGVDDVDGALVGGASLKAADFQAIGAAAPAR